MIKKLLFLLILNVFFVNFTSSFYSLPKYSSKLNMAASQYNTESSYTNRRNIGPNPPPDIPSHFLSKRIIIPTSPTVIISSLLYLQEQSNFEEITLQLMPPLSISYKDSLAIIDVLSTIKCPIKTIGIGMLEGPLTLLLAQGNKNMRTIHSNSFISFTPIQSQTRGQASDIHINAKIVQKQHEKVKEIIKKTTSLSDIKIEEYFSGRNIVLDANEALEAGIVDQII